MSNSDNELPLSFLILFFFRWAWVICSCFTTCRIHYTLNILSRKCVRMYSRAIWIVHFDIVDQQTPRSSIVENTQLWRNWSQNNFSRCFCYRCCWLSFSKHTHSPPYEIFHHRVQALGLRSHATTIETCASGTSWLRVEQVCSAADTCDCDRMQRQSGSSKSWNIQWWGMAVSSNIKLFGGYDAELRHEPCNSMGSVHGTERS